MNSTDAYYDALFDNLFKYLYRYVIPVCYIAGNCGSLISIYIFSTKAWRKNVCVFYFNTYLAINLAALNCYLLASILITGYDVELYNSNVIFCKLFYYATFLFCALSPTTLILASIDRLLISSQNVSLRLYSSKRLAYFSVSLSTVVCIIYFLHVLIKPEIVSVAPSATACTLSTDYGYLLFFAYSSLLVTSFFCINMIVLSVLSIKNVRIIRAAPRQQQRQQLRTMNKKDFQLIRCLFIHDIVFIACNIFLNLYYVYVVVRFYGRVSTLERIFSNFLNSFLTMLQQLSFCASFFIFVTVSKAFRHELRRIVYKMIRKNSVTMREEEQIERINVEINIFNENGQHAQ